MTEEIQALLDQYWEWLRDKTTLRRMNGWVEITTPYLDRHNDRLQIYAMRRGSGYVLADGGYVLDDLEQSGCKIDGGRREALLTMTLNGFGVQRSGESAPGQCIEKQLRASEAQSRAGPCLPSTTCSTWRSPWSLTSFYEDVANWLDVSNVRYTPNVKFTGASGYDHLFQFVIPKSAEQPERILHPINRPNRDRAQAMAFSWIDTKDVRPSESRAYAILNDSEARVSGERARRYAQLRGEPDTVVGAGAGARRARRIVCEHSPGNPRDNHHRSRCRAGGPRLGCLPRLAGGARAGHRPRHTERRWSEAMLSACWV